MEQELRLTIRENLPSLKMVPGIDHASNFRSKTVEQKIRDQVFTSSKRKRSNIDLPTRHRIFANLYIMHGGKCHWCGKDVNMDDNHRLRGTIDHLISQGMGRRNYYHGGHVLSCSFCNQERNLAEGRQKKKENNIRIRLTFDKQPV